MHDGLRHIVHPHRLKACLCAPASGMTGKHLLQLGKQVDELVVFAKDHAGTQQRQAKWGFGSGRRASANSPLCFAALVHRWAVHIGTQSADVNQARDIFSVAGPRQVGRQGDVRVSEFFFCPVQDGDEVDHHIVAMHQGLQLFGVVHIGLHHTSHPASFGCVEQAVGVWAP